MNDKKICPRCTNGRIWNRMNGKDVDTGPCPICKGSGELDILSRFEDLAVQLSPENLSCDGELTIEIRAFWDTVINVRSVKEEDYNVVRLRLRLIYDRLPESVRDQVLLHGFYDSEVRDAIYVYLSNHPEAIVLQGQDFDSERSANLLATISVNVKNEKLSDREFRE